MASIKVHGVPFSANVASVIGCLFEKDLHFEIVPVDLGAGEHKKEPFLSINPFGQIPGFEDGDLKLFESRAITQYIAHQYADSGAKLVSRDVKTTSLISTWIEVESHQFDPPASKLTWELVIKPIFGLGATDAAIVEENEAKLAKVLDVYETRLASSKYLAGDNFTLADLHHLPIINHLIKTESKKLFESRPHVNAWVTNILARPAWAKVRDLQKKP